MGPVGAVCVYGNFPSLTHAASRRQSRTTSTVGWIWGEVRHFGSLGLPHAKIELAKEAPKKNFFHHSQSDCALSAPRFVRKQRALFTCGTKSASRTKCHVSVSSDSDCSTQARTLWALGFVPQIFKNYSTQVVHSGGRKKHRNKQC